MILKIGIIYAYFETYIPQFPQLNLIGLALACFVFVCFLWLDILFNLVT